MKILRIGLPVAGIAWFAFVAIAFFLHFGPNAQLFGVSTRAASMAAGHSAGSIGNERHKMLIEATRLYSEANEAVSSEVSEGTAFAPVVFLNSRLESLGAKWRVRSTDGLEAKIYEIS